jgi:transcriptional regulator with XRE-family HTH domain
MARPSKDTAFNEQFAKRLQAACENNPNIPPKYHNERGYICDQMEKSGAPVSTETLRKWLKGETLPTLDKIARLAKILRVEPSLLAFGDQKA